MNDFWTLEELRGLILAKSIELDYIGIFKVSIFQEMGFSTDG